MTFRAGVGRRLVAIRSMSAFVLLHIVLASEGLVACRAVDVLLAGVLLAVTGSVTRGSEGVGAIITDGVRAWIFLFGSLGTGGGGRVGCGVIRLTACSCGR